VQAPPWTTTSSGRREQTFTPGDQIRYAFRVDNLTGRTVSANVRFDAYWGTRDQRPVNIFDILFREAIPPGSVTVYSSVIRVPGDALPGSYTEQADVADRTYPADRAGQYGTFDVAGKMLLSVPYLSQQGAGQRGTQPDGPACAAMVLRSHPGLGQPTVRDVQDFIAAIASGHPSPGVGPPVPGEELEYALEHYGVPQGAISQISLDGQGLPQAQITDMAIAIKQGSPVIAFIDGKDLPSARTGTRSYTSHWLVIVGLAFNSRSGTEVLVNDPGNTSGNGGIQGQPISIGNFEQGIADTASMPAAQQEPNHIAGIVVASAPGSLPTSPGGPARV
jgi:hypothetical protein